MVSGCQGPGVGLPYAVCDPSVPDGVIARAVGCADEIPSGHADGRSSDLYLATPALRAVVRHPEASLGRVGVGGATLVDVAPWGADDALYEVVPVVGGGWLDVDAFALDDAGVSFEGVVRPFQGEVADAEGERRTLRWTADGDAVTAEGADALLVHADGVWLGGALWGTSVLRGEGGSTDRGGVVRLDGDTLVVSPSFAPDLADATVHVTGSAPGADTIVLASDVASLGFVQVVDGAFAFDAPATVSRVRAEASGRAASAWKTPGEGLSLAVGGEGWLTVSGLPRVGVASWVAQDGRSGRSAVDGRSRIAVGDGLFDVRIDAGPTVAPLALQVPDAPLVVRPETSFDPGLRRALVVPSPASRSRDWRGTDADAVLDAIARGADLVVLAPEGDVGEAPEDASIAAVGGSALVSADGWRIVAWPFAVDRRQGGRGAVDPAGRSPMQAFRTMQGGDRANRITVVDLEWLAAVGAPPADLAPGPDAVLLDGPVDPLVDWAPWFAWLDRGVALAPVGPLTWATVPDPALFGREDVERGLLRGQVVAGTGPVIDLFVDHAAPGEVARPSLEVRKVRVDVRGCACLHGALIGDGRIVGTFVPSAGPAAFDVRFRGSWLLAVAWSDDGAWATTGPVWTNPPP